MNAERVIGIGCVALGLVLYFFGTGKEATDAYVFPNICGMVMGGLGVIMVLTAGAQETTEGGSSVISSVPWGKLWPAFVVLVAYLYLAEIIGFFTSSFLTFVALGITYSAQTEYLPVTRRCIPIAFGFLAVLYALFVLLLKVQLPAGMFF
jgi:hypothetical protein